MASILEQLSQVMLGLQETVQPFLPWKDSPIREWKVTLKMLNIGELVNLAERVSEVSPMEAAYLSKIHLLASSVISINNLPLVTPEDVDDYNKEHNFTGIHAIDLYGYKVLFIKKLSDLVVNRLAFAYDELQDRYVTKHLGRPLPDELKAAKVGDTDISKVGKDESSNSNEESCTPSGD